ncbi:TRAP transporter large permease [Vineibacter terrae]|uniref:TRAP transporter large permease protein n=1 Tax=Vineibacter terrae TaxID=2586908 RepID=A0A5C8PET9_9HYPH|nr:TRAP transporter large permease [Vineibacter terrae]TXL72310.1 TRAP transporter large permease [Vineibacter terrae]
MLALVVLLFFFVLILAGMPIFGAMGTASLAGVMLLGESDTPLLNLALTIYQTLGNFLLIAVPLYIYAGTLMEVAGLNEKLFKFARVWVGRVPGGLGVATVVACAIFAAICGSSVATAVTIGLVAFPALVKGGYKPPFSGALIAAGGTLGILIPPSIAMIIFGVLTEQSIAQLFVAGALPGVLLAALMALYTMFFSKVAADPEPITWKERIAVTREAIWVLLLPVGVLASIYSGLATATEVAALAVVYVIAVGLWTRTLTRAHFVDATLRATRTSVMIFMMIAFGQALTEFFTLTGLPQLVVDLVAQAGLGFVAVVTLMVLIYILLGTFLEATSMLLVSVPIMFPLAKSIGMHPLAFAVFVVLAVEVAQIHPPFGINLYALSGVGKVHIGRMSISVIPYVIMMIGMMFAIAFFPGIATWLPGTMR